MQIAGAVFLPIGFVHGVIGMVIGFSRSGFDDSPANKC